MEPRRTRLVLIDGLLLLHHYLFFHIFVPIFVGLFNVGLLFVSLIYIFIPVFVDLFSESFLLVILFDLRN
jgi:hypothetical protein